MGLLTLISEGVGLQSTNSLQLEKCGSFAVAFVNEFKIVCVNNMQFVEQEIL